MMTWEYATYSTSMEYRGEALNPNLANTKRFGIRLKGQRTPLLDVFCATPRIPLLRDIWRRLGCVFGHTMITVASRCTSQHLNLRRQLWYQFTDSGRMVGPLWSGRETRTKNLLSGARDSHHLLRLRYTCPGIRFHDDKLAFFHASRRKQSEVECYTSRYRLQKTERLEIIRAFLFRLLVLGSCSARYKPLSRQTGQFSNQIGHFYNQIWHFSKEAPA